MSTKVLTARERIINESFGWLKDYTVTSVDGKQMMTAKGETVPFNVATVLDEKEFLRDWLMPFALGNYHGYNYFKTTEWLEISEEGLKSVMVVDENNKPMLIIPPLSSNNLGPEQYRMFRNLELAIKDIAADNMRKDNPMASADLAHESETSLAKVAQRTITDLVSPWYFEKHNIVPEAEQKLYYIRDNINNGELTADDLTKARPILYKAHRNELVTQEEKDFINKLVKNQWDVDFGTGAVKSTDSGQNGVPPAEEKYDPLEC